MESQYTAKKPEPETLELPEMTQEASDLGWPEFLQEIRDESALQDK